MHDPLDAITWPVRTERLEIRRATPADANRTWRFRRLPEVYAWITAAPDNEHLHRTIFVSPEVLALTLVIELDGVVIGDVMLRVQDSWSQFEIRDRAAGTRAELGWCLDPAYGGRGYATEAIRAVLGQCFGALDLHRVIAQCFTENEPSWRLMERVGMRRESHTIKDALHRSGDWKDGFLYAVLAEEWRD